MIVVFLSLPGVPTGPVRELSVMRSPAGSILIGYRFFRVPIITYIK